MGFGFLLAVFLLTFVSLHQILVNSGSSDKAKNKESSRSMMMMMMMMMMVCVYMCDRVCGTASGLVLVKTLAMGCTIRRGQGASGRPSVVRGSG